MKAQQTGKLNSDFNCIQHNIADRHRKTRKINLPKQILVTRKNISCISKASRKKCPQHRPAIIKQNMRNPIRTQLRQITEDKRIHHRRKKRTDNKPKRAQNSLLILRNKIPLYKKSNQVPIPNHFTQRNIQQFAFRLYHQIPAV